MFIAIDFDGTCVTNDYPNVGRDIGAAPVLRELVKNKHRLILHTNRTGKELSDALNWFIQNNIPLFGVNKNPVQWRFSKSPKVFAHLYIDDAALGCPLTTDKAVSDKPFVNWSEAAKLLNEICKIPINPDLMSGLVDIRRFEEHG